MEILLSLVAHSSLSTTQAGSLAGPVVLLLCALLAGCLGWQVTDRVLAWRQDSSDVR